MKNTAQTEYYRNIRKVLESKLNRGKMIKAMNAGGGRSERQRKGARVEGKGVGKG